MAQEGEAGDWGDGKAIRIRMGVGIATHRLFESLMHRIPSSKGQAAVLAQRRYQRSRAWRIGQRIGRFRQPPMPRAV
ncbi:hypothetical protein Acid7E03_11000 [Acidisoma sp. 7E03]